MPGAQDVSPARASQTATPGPKRTRRSPDDPSDSASSDAESASGEGAAAGALVGVELLAEGCGTIQKIELTDFMSHKNFKIELGPDVNFITGPNGSGKSSIVTALQVALGMKAFDTKRATSLGELIRNGANGCAVVRVTLSNKGSDACVARAAAAAAANRAPALPASRARACSYKPSEYGDAIVVERIIGPGNKGSSHRLLSKAGKVVEKTAAAVKGLCELWHLYVDNPCCVLDQENAKAFLNSTPEEKYRFALRASDLMTVHQNYELELNTRLQAKDDLAQLSKQLPSIEQAARVAQKELDEIQRLDTLHEQLKASEGEVFWAGVIELEDKLKKDEEVVGKRRCVCAPACRPAHIREGRNSRRPRKSCAPSSTTPASTRRTWRRSQRASTRPRRPLTRPSSRGKTPPRQ
jgi:energy-coupling factor transporter ATP-binding protein EcfA2